MVGLAFAVCLPVILLQLYKIFVGPIGFGIQMAIGTIVSAFVGIGLYLTYRSSARNEP